MLLANGLTLLSSDRGLAPRALRDIKPPVARAGSASRIPSWRWRWPAAPCWGWASCCRRAGSRRRRAADAVTEDVLRLFGMTADEAREICPRPLPDLDKAGTAA